MRNREKIWRKYKTPETWMAFDVEKKRYNTLLRQAKEESIKCKVVECKNNTKKLYKLDCKHYRNYKSKPFSRSNVRQGDGR